MACLCAFFWLCNVLKSVRSAADYEILRKRAYIQFRPVVEELPPDTFIGSISTNSVFLKAQHSTLAQYFLIPSKQSHFFRLNATNGRLFIAHRFDRDTFCIKYLKCCDAKHDVPLKIMARYMKSGSISHCIVDLTVKVVEPTRSELYVVLIEVQDINDNAPYFHRKRIELSLPENKPIGSLISLPLATDKDSSDFAIAGYQLTTRSKYFALRVYRRRYRISHLYMVVISELNREVMNSHFIEVKAFDKGGEYGIMKVLINVTDVNDCTPKFKEERYHVSIYKWFPVHSIILQVKAEDDDENDNGRITYSFSKDADETVKKRFSIDIETGDIFLRSSLVIEQYQSHTFSVVAQDNGQVRLSASVLVIVEVKPPMKESLRIYASGLEKSDVLKLDENLNPGFTASSITALSTSLKPVSQMIHCHIEPHTDFFSLSSVYDNIFSLKTKLTLDRENMSSLVLYITCVNQADVNQGALLRLRIEVLDKNDNAPEFIGKTSFSIRENNYPKATVGRIQAIDDDEGENGEIRFSIFDSMNVPFAINEISGVLSSLSSLDREHKSFWLITIIATDGGERSLSSSMNITVHVTDANDNIPQFSQSIPESIHIPSTTSPKEPFLICNATDADAVGVNSELLFYLTNFQDIFKISKYGELYYIGKSSSFIANKYMLGIIVRDGGNPSLMNQKNVSIYIQNVNEHQPKFMTKKLDINITTCAVNGSIIAKVRAFDPDKGMNGAIRYSFINRNFSTSMPFKINPTTGEISVHLPANRRRRLYRVIVKAKDLGIPSFSDRIMIVFRMMQSLQNKANFSDRKYHQESNFMIIIVIALTTFLFFVTFFCIYHVFGSQRRETETNEAYSTYV